MGVSASAGMTAPAAQMPQGLYATHRADNAEQSNAAPRAL
jgi:hypothetical protein